MSHAHKRPRLEIDLTRTDDLSAGMECKVCTEAKPQRKFMRATSGCASHQHNICQKCLVQDIEVQMNGKGRAGALLVCPSIGCGSQYSSEDLKRVLKRSPGGASIVAKYEQRLLQAALERDPEFRWCPRNKCGNGQLVEAVADSTFWRCAACRTRICVQHRDVFHEGQTCQQYDASLHEKQNAEALTMAALPKLGVKQCPSCRQGLSKESGCDHFTCKGPLGCGWQFCWLCKASWGPISRMGNKHHQPTCRYYA
eukprot:TRINITY_DN18898_c0_g1_i1.p1 TRINITY_DN18898_c0_g1~~TRINITY_DN18898_c0_g1_i1.p1  ORF type:complete len:254 (-),score=35.57 TRINITY_DN18898_c0_g1_i1:609-1370(-)